MRDTNLKFMKEYVRTADKKESRFQEEKRMNMQKEISLLNKIHENADMGLDSLKHIAELSRDQEFTKAILNWMNEYREAYQKSEELLRVYRQEEGKDAPAMGKMMSNIMSKIKNMADPSTSKLAEMVLEGATMGITQLTRQVNDYDGNDKKVAELAKELLKKEEKNVEAMKKFL